MTPIKILFFTLLLSGFPNVLCQDYDLIITNKGDSIACHIDTITADAFHFEMKFNNNWIQTKINKSEVREYKLDAVSKETVKFKPGTSQIGPNLEAKTYQNIRKNSIYAENYVILPSIGYERFLTKGDEVGIVLKAGFFYYAQPILIAESSLVVGYKVHFFEVGGGWGGKNHLGLFGRVGYRYMSRKGLLIKGGIHIIKNVPVFPTIGIGFSF